MPENSKKSAPEPMAHPTIVDVAKLAGVAVSTASMALNGKSSIKAATREKVCQAAEILNYVPNQAARSLHGHKTYSIGALHWPSLNPLHTENSLQLMQLSANCNYNFKIFWKDIYRPETIKPFIQSIRGSIDGLILYSPANTETQKLLIEQLQKYNIPFVFSAYIDRSDVDFVTPDLRNGAQLAMEYLLESGHKNIATFDSGGSLVDRGIADALQKYGQEFHPVCSVNRNITTYADAYQMSMQLLTASDQTTAVFARSDFIALALLKAAWDLGRTPGRDLDIVSMDNTEQAAYYVPALTTVDFNKQKKNQLLLNILMQRINKQNIEPQQIFIEPELIVRESSALKRKAEK